MYTVGPINLRDALGYYLSWIDRPILMDGVETKQQTGLSDDEVEEIREAWKDLGYSGKMGPNVVIESPKDALELARALEVYMNAVAEAQSLSGPTLESALLNAQMRLDDIVRRKNQTLFARTM